MIHHERTLIIDATPNAVWSILSRFMHIDEFAPMVKSVEALSDVENGIGAKRRCHFNDGGSMAEEVLEWEDNHRFKVLLYETEPMPLKKAYAEIRIKPQGTDQTHVTWSMDYSVKYGPFGWLLGQTMMKIMMGKVIDGNLKGLADKVNERAL